MRNRYPRGEGRIKTESGTIHVFRGCWLKAFGLAGFGLFIRRGIAADAMGDARNPPMILCIFR